MIQIKAGKRKVVASLLTFCFFLQQSFCLQVLATNISGVNGNNGVFDITPTAKNPAGDIGFRKYQNFELSEGDIANLIFHLQGQDLSKFVNLVDNTINIQGIVNAVNKNGDFTNGHAVFISPNGMIVGASGVLNVGSLSVLTPDQVSYDKYKSDLSRPSLIADYESRLGQGNGTVQIDGKVLARDLVDIKAADVNISQNAAVMAGVKDATKLISKAQAEALFNQLVKADNTVSGNSFANDSGTIKITSYGTNGGVNVAGTMKNFGAGNTEITNSGSKGISVSGSISNGNGSTTLTNSNGAINISGTVSNNNGTMSLLNTGSGIKIASTGNVSNNGTLLVSNEGADGIQIDGNVSNKNGNASITNRAGELLVNGTVSNNGPKLTITNTGSGLTISSTGNIENIGELAMSNSGADGLVIAGAVNNQGTSNITNTGSGELLVSGSYTNKGNSVFTNEGSKGLTINGVVGNNGKLLFDNSADALTVNGTITNIGELTLDNSGSNGLLVNGTITNSSADATLTNTGSKGIIIADTAKVTNKDNAVNLNNTGKGGILVKGSVKGNGINIDNTNSNVVIGHTSGKDFLTSTSDVNINIKDGSLLNSGTKANLIKADNNLNIEVQNGTIGLGVGNCEDGVCTGVDPNSRDFTKSVNVNVAGKINAQTKDTKNTNDNLLINMASRGSDMNIDKIHADGRVILLADYDENDKSGSLLNAASDSSIANVEGTSISLIASDNIGTADKKLTFKLMQMAEWIC